VNERGLDAMMRHHVALKIFAQPVLTTSLTDGKIVARIAWMESPNNEQRVITADGDTVEGAMGSLDNKLQGWLHERLVELERARSEQRRGLRAVRELLDDPLANMDEALRDLLVAIQCDAADLNAGSWQDVLAAEHLIAANAPRIRAAMERALLWVMRDVATHFSEEAGDPLHLLQALLLEDPSREVGEARECIYCERLLSQADINDVARGAHAEDCPWVLALELLDLRADLDPKNIFLKRTVALLDTLWDVASKWVAHG
jgi:hypothetical protein